MVKKKKKGKKKRKETEREGGETVQHLKYKTKIKRYNNLMR